MSGHGGIFGLLRILTRIRSICHGLHTGRDKLCRTHRTCHTARQGPVRLGILYLSGHDGQSRNYRALLDTYINIIGSGYCRHDSFRHIRYARHRPATEGSHGIGIFTYTDRRIRFHHSHVGYATRRTRLHHLPHSGGSLGTHHIHHTILHTHGRPRLQLRGAAPPRQTAFPNRTIL